MKIKDALKKLLNSMLDFLFPRECIKCGNSGGYLCKSCFDKIEIKKILSCPDCGRENLLGEFCGGYCKNGYYFDRLIYCFDYEKKSWIKNLIVNLKYKFSEDAGNILGAFMARQFLAYFGEVKFRENFVLVPVPLSAKKLKYRGFNQSKILCDQLKTRFDLTVLDCFYRHESTSQVKLNRLERAKNIRETIFIPDKFKEDVNGKFVILIDDIATTLSTLNECSRILKKAGARQICCFTLARRWRN
ncbi:hypothetical protein A3B60_02700 [Candidatus Peregrinibacteria bacterium RIFCSPLOWO2_01_FULL_39_12]|nr:MAG: hypothetical protein A3I58_03660 [Candidatus Peregrinibacteria bacterium RIFCSPLOWO2_02_FULL_39_10]OGJ42652.1 MAG: hypothetical protein A3B60_02700 [Candidatus Peregrinibacteria bacterium RIFCSPLOWO2_01_FULL_39_12]